MRLYTEAEIAAALDVTPQAVNKRATKGRRDRKGNLIEAPWPVHSTRREQNGNRTKLYAFDTLPDDVRAALVEVERPAPPSVGEAARLLWRAILRTIRGLRP